VSRTKAMRERNDLMPSSITARVLFVNIPGSILYAEANVINRSLVDKSLPKSSSFLVGGLFANRDIISPKEEGNDDYLL